MSAACLTPGPTAPERGVSRDLALSRAERISEVVYRLRFVIPESVQQPIQGRETVSFLLDSPGLPVALDFNAPDGEIESIRRDGKPIDALVENGHVVIPAEALGRGRNTFEILFTAGEQSLNRRDEYLYTLFVPDRASTAFPCFDQPDLKAEYQLELAVPPGWEAVANGEAEEVADYAQGRIYRFDATKPMSTYLFSFAAGRFEVLEKNAGGRRLRFLHREEDEAKVERNAAEIFRLHARALEWLEEYTGIEYPFGKFDFVLIPDFQYGGMEHPGAILYRASRLLLDESATQSEKLGRASLISHETAHMWFGDLVTMRWFNDVWTKEVFANFMAAKIAHPLFPELDHDLRFLLAHYPPAYAVDRSQGPNPIRQDLDNLLDAGTLYGAIIYQKAPIVMRQLEALVGPEAMREGLREYLSRFSYGNATWPDLIQILDRATQLDLRAWSQVWVEEPGRPVIRARLSATPAGGVEGLALEQSDSLGRGRLWTQDLEPVLAANGQYHRLPVRLRGRQAAIPDAKGLPAPDFFLPNGAGLGYARFELDERSIEYLLENLHSLESPLLRASAWLGLWDNFLEGRIERERMLGLSLRMLREESVVQILERVLADLETLFWRFLPESKRGEAAQRVDSALWEGLEKASEASLKKSFFDACVQMAFSEAAVNRLRRIWSKELEVEGMPLSSRDYTDLAMELAVREAAGWSGILDEQAGRLAGKPERQARLEFIRPALSADPSARREFFDSLSDPERRAREPWVLTALGYLHHPLRAQSARPMIRQALEMLEEIQRTGDIFFPKRWLDATLNGHSTPEAVDIVHDFLESNRGLPERLRGKVLQSADLLFRSAKR